MIEHDGQARRHYNVTFALLSLVAVSYALLPSLVAPALPDIQHDLHTSVNAVSWVLTAYLLSASIATPLIGRLGDMYGKERLLVAVLVLLCAATIVSALATSLAVMLIGRVVQGAAGGVFPLAFGIIRDEFPRERVAGAVGVMSALAGVGGGAGVVLAGPIVQRFSYHWLFRAPLVVLVPATIAVHLFVPESPVRVPGRVNWAGAALMSGGLAGVLLAVSEAPVWGWLSGRTLGVLAVGLALLLAWVRSEARSPNPLVDMRMMRIRGGMEHQCGGAEPRVWNVRLVHPAAGVRGDPHARRVRLRLLGDRRGAVPGAVDDRDAPRRCPDGPAREALRLQATAAAGAALSCASYLLLAVARTERWEIYVAALLLGAGIGLAFASMVNLIIENVGPAQTGVATGVNTVTRTVGGAFGGAATASILAGTVGVSGYPSAQGFTIAIAACAVALALGVVVGLAIPQRRPADAFAPHEAGDLSRQEVAAASAVLSTLRPNDGTAAQRSIADPGGADR